MKTVDGRNGDVLGFEISEDILLRSQSDYAGGLFKERIGMAGIDSTVEERRQKLEVQ